jgi:hypothetical protein
MIDITIGPMHSTSMYETKHTGITPISIQAKQKNSHLGTLLENSVMNFVKKRTVRRV